MYERRDAACAEFIKNMQSNVIDEDLEIKLRIAFKSGWKARKELDYKPLTSIP